MALVELRESVLQAVDDAFRSLGLPAAQRARPKETILLKNGCYAGQVFRAGGRTVVWLAETDAIEIVSAATASVDAVRQAEEMSRAA